MNAGDQRLIWQVEERQPQRLTIAVSGPDVAWLDGNREPATEDSEEAIPDLVARWARAVKVGLLGSELVPPESCSAAVETRHRHDLRHSWTIQIDRVDWGAVRVLANLLLARKFDEVALRSESSPVGRAETLRLPALSFPHFHERLAIMVHRAEIVKGSRDRAVKVGFAGPPEDPAVDAVIDALDLWAELVTWGGYASPGVDPRESGAIPDGALLYDEVTVAQTFSQAFYADEAAFDGVVSYALASRARNIPVVEVLIQ